MAGLNSQSLNWLDQLDTLKANPNASRTELQEILGFGNTQITRLQALEDCFNSAAAEKVRQAAKADPPFILSSKSALALTSLNGKVTDLPATLHAALDLVLARRLKTEQIKALVKWIIQGNSQDTFQESASPQKGSSSHLVGAKQVDDLDQLAQLVEWARVEKAQGGGKTTAQDKLKAHLGKLSPSAKTVGDASGTSSPTNAGTLPAKNKKSKKGSGNPNLLLEWAVGINPLSQLKSKVKKGGSFTLGDWGLIFLEFLGKLLRLLKHPFKWIHASFKFVCKIIIDSLKTLGIYNFVKAVVTLALLALLLWTAWDIRQYGLMHPFRTVWAFIPHTHCEPTPLNPEPETAPPAQSPPHLRLAHSHPMIPYQPKTSAWTTADETQDYLDQELFPVSKDSVIKTHAFEPDTAMGSDMAYHLVMDLQSPDKYTVFCGRDKAAVKTITTGASQITLTMQIGLLSPLTGSSTFNFYWADLKQLHCDVIESGLAKKFLCSLVLVESKKPLTIQCDSAVDLERLVSALEFYIKLSGHNAAPLTGLPYLNQGLRLNKDGVVTTLWADSPIAKAGLVLGDVPWSVGTKTDHPQSKAVLEAGLQSLASGSNDLYYVTADGWKRARKASDPNDPDSFRPLRRKVSLTTF